MDDRGFTLDTQAVVHAYRYRSSDACGIVLGEGSPEAQRGGGRVRLNLDGSVLSESWRRHAILHRQNGSTQELPLARSGSGATVELLLDRRECAVIQV